MDDFTVKLGTITNGKNSFSFEIKDPFFEAFTFSDVEHADITAKVLLERDGENILLNLVIYGEINQLACDICTEELSLKISAETNVIIKKTDDNLVSNDEIFYIKKSENKLNLKHLIFELIVLNSPKKRKHPLDKEGNSTCNQEMVNLVSKYTQVKEKSSDPRWDALKNLK